MSAERIPEDHLRRQVRYVDGVTPPSYAARALMDDLTWAVCQRVRDGRYAEATELREMYRSARMRLYGETRAQAVEAGYWVMYSHHQHAKDPSTNGAFYEGRVRG